MNTFVTVSALFLWAVNLVALVLIARYLDWMIKNRDYDAKFLDLAAKLVLVSGKVGEVKELVKEGNKDQQEIKTRLHWERERELKLAKKSKK